MHGYVRQNVDWNGADPRELGLETYTQRLKERLVAAIEPVSGGGQAPLLPLLNRHKPQGTTADVDFTTTRPVHTTIRSHVNAVVLDADWERCAAFYLEQQRETVEFYVRNDRPFLTIPYEYEGITHYYEPDYIVRLANETNLLLEIKGYEDDQTKAKHQGARRWISAVNHWAQLGRWDFLVCHNPHELSAALRRAAGRR